MLKHKDPGTKQLKKIGSMELASLIISTAQTSAQKDGQRIVPHGHQNNTGHQMMLS